MDIQVRGGEAQITFDLRDLEDILMDLRAARDSFDLEPRTEDLIEQLYELGVK